MLLAADPLANFIQANPTIVMLALGFLLMIGTVLIADGFGVHVPEGLYLRVDGLRRLHRRAQHAGAKAAPGSGADTQGGLLTRPHRWHAVGAAFRRHPDGQRPHISSHGFAPLRGGARPSRGSSRAGGPAAAADTPVDVALILAIDVSRSIDVDEAQLQREGYVEAFRDPELIRAIGSGFLGKIAVGYFEWAGEGYARIIVPWTLIDGEKSAHAFADALSHHSPLSERRTSISGPSTSPTHWFDGNGFQGTRRVVDISGDGPNNDGELVTIARRRAIAAGITINGLPILKTGGGFYSPLQYSQSRPLLP